MSEKSHTSDHANELVYQEISLSAVLIEVLVVGQADCLGRRAHRIWRVLGYLRQFGEQQPLLQQAQFVDGVTQRFTEQANRFFYNRMFGRNTQL